MWKSLERRLYKQKVPNSTPGDGEEVQTRIFKETIVD